MWEEGFVYFGLLIISYLSLPIYGSGFKSLDFDDDNPLGSLKDYAYYDDPNLQLHLNNLIPSASDMSNLSDCQKQCTQRFSETLQLIMKQGTHYERFNNVCKKYTETVECMNKVMCGHRELFDVATSGLHYMCVEQREAFEASIECIDVHADSITKECDGACHLEERFTSWAMNSGIMETFREGKAPNINGDFLQRFITDGCDLAKCYLSCVKSNFNQRCNGSAGAMLSEVFVRPLAESHNLVAFSSMANLMSMFVPKECSFILTNRGLEPYRIDPTLNKELKKMYKSRVEEETTPGPEDLETSTKDMLPPEMSPGKSDESPLDPSKSGQDQSHSQSIQPPQNSSQNAHQKEQTSNQLELKPAPSHDNKQPQIQDEARTFEVKVPPSQDPSLNKNHLPPHPSQVGPIQPPPPQVIQPRVLQNGLPPQKIVQIPPQNRANQGPYRPQLGINPRLQNPYMPQAGPRMNNQAQPQNRVVNTPFGALQPPPSKSARILDKEGEFYHKKLYANKTVLVEIMVYPEFEGQLSCEIRRR